MSANVKKAAKAYVAVGALYAGWKAYKDTTQRTVKAVAINAAAWPLVIAGVVHAA